VQRQKDETSVALEQKNLGKPIVIGKERAVLSKQSIGIGYSVIDSSILRSNEMPFVRIPERDSTRRKKLEKENRGKRTVVSVVSFAQISLAALWTRIEASYLDLWIMTLSPKDVGEIVLVLVFMTMFMWFGI